MAEPQPEIAERLAPNRRHRQIDRRAAPPLPTADARPATGSTRRRGRCAARHCPTDADPHRFDATPSFAPAQPARGLCWRSSSKLALSTKLDVLTLHRHSPSAGATRSPHFAQRLGGALLGGDADAPPPGRDDGRSHAGRARRGARWRSQMFMPHFRRSRRARRVECAAVERALAVDIVPHHRGAHLGLEREAQPEGGAPPGAAAQVDEERRRLPRSSHFSAYRASLGSKKSWCGRYCWPAMRPPAPACHGVSPRGRPPRCTARRTTASRAGTRHTRSSARPTARRRRPRPRG